MRQVGGPLFTFRMIPLIAGELAQSGIDCSVLLGEAGLPLEAQRGDVTAPLPRVLHFIELASERLGNDLLGLTLAERNPAGAYAVAEFLVRAAPNVEIALQMLSNAAVLINPSLRFEFDADANEGRLMLSVVGQRDTIGRHLNEYTFSYILRQFSSVLDGGLQPTRAWFTHSRDRNAEAVAQHFGCDVRFQARDCGIAIPRTTLTRAARTSDPPLFAFLLQQARNQLSRIGSSDIVSQVMRVIEVRLARGDVGAAAVAAAMATTVRSLQRHLGEAGTTYREVLDHVRLRRLEELRRGGVAESDIARELGFADAKSMRRAIKQKE
ncbi:MAG TPA: AraC family transcriptional regulator ligand-binding domain-containing protein [Kofleriaceae bacterium]